MVEQACKLKLGNILDDDQVRHVVNQVLGRDEWHILSSEIKPAAEGLSGFLGDHFKAVITVEVDDQKKKIQLFIKSMPLDNKPKADFIDEFKFFKREVCSLKLFAEMEEADEPNPWCTKALFNNELMIVMPDLSALGYTLFPKLKSLDLAHALVAAASLARFHAACANYETKMSQQIGHRYTVTEAFGGSLVEYSFTDTPWMRGAAKVSADLLKVYSDKYKNIPDLRNKITKLFLEGCDSLTEHPDTLNVLIHKDLWANNIMFRYDDKGLPVNAIIIDFQCVRYTPPAYDVMSLLYLTSTRSFRDQHETDICKFYYSNFMDKIDSSTKRRLKDLQYDEEDFMKWCERCRLFALLHAITLYPYTLMDQNVAKQNFDDPATFDMYIDDRSAPVLAHCRDSDVYRDLQLEVSEEFVERFILDKLN